MQERLPGNPAFVSGNKRTEATLQRLAGYYEEALSRGDDLSAMELVDEMNTLNNMHKAPKTPRLKVIPGGKK